MARLDRLGENGKRTVQPSVIGRQFLVRLLDRIAGLTGQLEGLLGELKSLEILYEQGLLPEPAYVFKRSEMAGGQSQITGGRVERYWIERRETQHGFESSTGHFRTYIIEVRDFFAR